MNLTIDEILAHIQNTGTPLQERLRMSTEHQAVLQMEAAHELKNLGKPGPKKEELNELNKVRALLLSQLPPDGPNCPLDGVVVWCPTMSGF